ncbi:MAG: carbohydrate ABC transporter permease [Anaerolineae bacterium]|jgi:multiple sugar transport system permease protein|nr:carbohydrate ABC transporter permease [Anaerolineae bacterium]
MTTKAAERSSLNAPKLARSANRGLLYAVAIVSTLIFIFPIIWLISASVKPNVDIYRAPLNLIPSKLDWTTYEKIFKVTPIGRYLVNSFLYALGGSLITMFFSILAAYGLSRHYFSGKQAFLAFLLIVQLVPQLVRIVPIYVMMSTLGLVNTQFGLILLYGVGGIAFGTWFLKGYFDSIPKDLDEAAWMDGANKLQTVGRILVPMMVPGLAALLILQFIGHWNDFTTAAVMLRIPDLRPLTVGIYTLIGPDEADFRLLSSAALVNIVPVVIVFAFLQRYLVAGLTAGAVKG